MCICEEVKNVWGGGETLINYNFIYEGIRGD